MKIIKRCIAAVLSAGVFLSSMLIGGISASSEGDMTPLSLEETMTVKKFISTYDDPFEFKSINEFELSTLIDILKVCPEPDKYIDEPYGVIYEGDTYRYINPGDEDGHPRIFDYVYSYKTAENWFKKAISPEFDISRYDFSEFENEDGNIEITEIYYFPYARYFPICNNVEFAYEQDGYIYAYVRILNKCDYNTIGFDMSPYESVGYFAINYLKHKAFSEYWSVRSVEDQCDCFYSKELYIFKLKRTNDSYAAISCEKLAEKPEWLKKLETFAHDDSLLDIERISLKTRYYFDKDSGLLYMVNYNDFADDDCCIIDMNNMTRRDFDGSFCIDRKSGDYVLLKHQEVIENGSCTSNYVYTTLDGETLLELSEQAGGNINIYLFNEHEKKYTINGEEADKSLYCEKFSYAADRFRSMFSDKRCFYKSWAESMYSSKQYNDFLGAEPECPDTNADVYIYDIYCWFMEKY